MGARVEPVEATTERAHPPLDRDTIVEAALRVARRSGLEHLTMKALAEELGVSTMAPYRHVRSKEELLELMVDALYARVMIPPPSAGTWQDRLRQLHASAFRELADYAGLSLQWPLLGVVTPRQRELGDAVLDLLHEAGFVGHEALLAWEALFAYVSGQLAIVARSRTGDGPDGRSVRVLGAYLSERPEDAATIPADEAFAAGYELVLTGLRVRLGERAGAARR